MPAITAALIQAAKTERSSAEDIEDITAKLEGAEGAGRRRSALSLVGAARRAGRSAGRAAAHGPQPAAGDAGQAGGRAVVGAQRHPARRRGAGTARADRGAAGRPQGAVAGHGLDRGGAGAADGDGRASRSAEKKRLSLLLEEKKKLQDRHAKRRWPASGRRSAALAGQGRQPEGADRLASRREIDGRKRSRRGARPDGGRAGAPASARRRWPASCPFRKRNRLAGPQPFSALQEQIALPVTGRIERRFGERRR